MGDKFEVDVVLVPMIVLCNDMQTIRFQQWMPLPIFCSSDPYKLYWYYSSLECVFHIGHRWQKIIIQYVFLNLTFCIIYFIPHGSVMEANRSFVF